VRLKVSPQQAWQLVGDFCAAKHWSSDVLKCEILSGAPNQIGTIRLLTLRNGGTAREQLIAYDAAQRSFSYTIIESDIPVVGYSATFAVVSDGSDGAVAEWSSRFEAASGATPAAARQIVERIYEIGLNSLLQLTGGQPGQDTPCVPPI
jgi:hypothetical protein